MLLFSNQNLNEFRFDARQISFSGSNEGEYRKKNGTSIYSSPKATNQNLHGRLALQRDENANFLYSNFHNV